MTVFADHGLPVGVATPCRFGSWPTPIAFWDRLGRGLPLLVLHQDTADGGRS
jgi:hypothetical protein